MIEALELAIQAKRPDPEKMVLSGYVRSGMMRIPPVGPMNGEFTT
jgi:hypothetical protein